MRVVIYSHAFAPSVGGAEKYVLLLAQGLSQRTAPFGGEPCEVAVVTPTVADGFDDSQLPFRVIREPSFAALALLLFRADVIQVAGPCFLPLLLGWIFKKAVVVEHHGYPASCPNGLLFYEPTKTSCPGHFMARRYRECLRCNAHTSGWLRSAWMLLWTFPRRWLCQRVAINAPITAHMVQRLALPRCAVIYYGIPDPLEGRQTLLSDFPTSRPLAFAYVGRLVGLKGLPVLLEAARRLKEEGYNFQLKLVGDGPERAALETRSRRLGLEDRVEFTGALTGKAFRSAMEDVAAVVMPSIWEETAGLAAIEQMMRGRLVIASEIGGLSEVVGDAGLKFAPGDSAALEACMKRVLDEPRIVAQLGSAARERALEMFRLERMIDDHLRIYGEILAARRSAVRVPVTQ